jgi:hypothetical protein
MLLRDCCESLAENRPSGDPGLWAFARPPQVPQEESGATAIACLAMFGRKLRRLGPRWGSRHIIPCDRFSLGTRQNIREPSPPLLVNFELQVRRHLKMLVAVDRTVIAQNMERGVPRTLA